MQPKAEEPLAAEAPLGGSGAPRVMQRRCWKGTEQVPPGLLLQEPSCPAARQSPKGRRSGAAATAG